MREEKAEGMDVRWQGGPAGGMWTARAGEVGELGKMEAGKQGGGSRPPPPPGLERGKTPEELEQRQGRQSYKTVINHSYKMILKRD